ncbi:unnamed protein product [Effrenium voratum]|nr:unnamed protein product [Effrenium voratum]
MRRRFGLAPNDFQQDEAERTFVDLLARMPSWRASLPPQQRLRRSGQQQADNAWVARVDGEAAEAWEFFWLQKDWRKGFVTDVEYKSLSTRAAILRQYSGPHFGPGDLAEIGVLLDHQVDSSADGGNFSIQVLTLALERFKMDLVPSRPVLVLLPWFVYGPGADYVVLLVPWRLDALFPAVPVVRVVLAIALDAKGQSRNHWFAIRKAGGVQTGGALTRFQFRRTREDRGGLKRVRELCLPGRAVSAPRARPGIGEESTWYEAWACLIGEAAELEVPSNTSVQELKLKAQREFGIHELVTSRGQLLRGLCTLREAGLRDGETISATVRSARLSSGRLCRAFALVRGDGTVVSWGDKVACGQYSDINWEELRDVQKIRPSSGAFAALLGNGRVLTWGDTSSGADSSAVRSQLHEVVEIESSAFAFAAIRRDGSVVTWGDPRFGGDSRQVRDQLVEIQHIAGSGRAFAAIRRDGRVVAWGSEDCGGDCGEVKDQLQDVVQVHNTYSAFAAIRRDGSVVTWGDKHGGGDISEVITQLEDVRKIHGSSYAFAAIRGNGQEIQGSNSAFAVIKSDGTVVAWGDRQVGGDCSNVQDQLTDVHRVSLRQSKFAPVTDSSLPLRGASERSSAFGENFGLVAPCTTEEEQSPDRELSEAEDAPLL